MSYEKYWPTYTQGDEIARLCGIRRAFGHRMQMGGTSKVQVSSDLTGSLGLTAYGGKGR